MNQIYSQAQAVDVWLGTADTTSDAGVTFLKTFYTLVFQDPSYQQSPSRDARTATIYPDSTPFHESTDGIQSCRNIAHQQLVEENMDTARKRPMPQRNLLVWLKNVSLRIPLGLVPFLISPSEP
ncbi:hypothetical protein LB505_012230 [Fusarium chuoi]|nr:hypothetical protein LB505_012230 [Fusarium chuoi]